MRTVPMPLWPDFTRAADHLPIAARYSGLCSYGLGAAAHALGMAVRNVERLCVDLVEAGMIARGAPRSWQAGAPWEPPGEEASFPFAASDEGNPRPRDSP